MKAFVVGCRGMREKIEAVVRDVLRPLIEAIHDGHRHGSDDDCIGAGQADCLVGVEDSLSVESQCYAV